MDVMLQIPDDIAGRMSAGDLSRRVLEAWAAEEYRLGHIDGFLKSHNVYDEYTMEDFERERQALKELGI
jgi:hypothetical protein